MRGIVKFFNSKKGYGFLTGEDHKDYFVHFSGINTEGYKELKQHEPVVFDVMETIKGNQAVNVVLQKTLVKK